MKIELTKKLREIYADVDSEEIRTLNEYVELLDNKVKKPEKLAFIVEYSKVRWHNIEANKEGVVVVQ